MVRAILLAGAAAAVILPGAAWAQRASENAVTNADDAFGTSVGLESTGIYSENDTRGFSPVKAGNARIDGIYFDPVPPLSGRLREATIIRVGLASEEFPFHAPTGIVDYRFRPWPKELGTSVGATSYPFWGTVFDWDLRLPIVRNHLALTGGLAYADVRAADGSNNLSWGWTARPIIRIAGAEIAPFAAVGRQFDSFPHTLVGVSGSSRLPAVPAARHYLGQNWTELVQHNENYGVTVKSRLTNRLSLRGGVFRAVGNKLRNYSDLYAISPSDAARATHLIISDPSANIHSTSGEALMALQLGKAGGWQHRIFAGYRARNRYTETGGSDRRSYGLVPFGVPDPQSEPDYHFSPVNAGRVRQSSWLLGYIGKQAGLGSINLGLQKAHYRATSRDGASGLVTGSERRAWLYNATLSADLTHELSLFVGTERGLEDSGAAPETAGNRNEQLPATLTTQYEGGLRWKFRGGQVVLSAFQISKPYFSFDADRRFVELGTERHRGIEASLAGHFGKRLFLLAGAVLMQPRVLGPAVGQGLVGNRPAGTPSVYSRIDANYRTDIFGGLTPTAAIVHTSSRAVGAKPLNGPGSAQLMVPGFTTVDLGLRQTLTIGKVPASFRAVVQNVFDAATWKVVAPDVMYTEERRRLTFSINADF